MVIRPFGLWPFRRAIFNVCVPYSSRDEMLHAFRSRASSDLATSTSKLSEHLYTSRNPHWTAPDLLIRTSGVSRLSDFLLWQVSPSNLLHIQTLNVCLGSATKGQQYTSYLATGQTLAWQTLCPFYWPTHYRFHPSSSHGAVHPHDPGFSQRAFGRHC